MLFRVKMEFLGVLQCAMNINQIFRELTQINKAATVFYFIFAIIHLSASLFSQGGVIIIII